MNQDALTLEESNKVRISLGMKPIGGPVEEGEEVPVDTTTIAEENYAQNRADAKRAKEEADHKERIAKSVHTLAHLSLTLQLIYPSAIRSKNQHALNAKLKGETLGGKSKDDTLDAASWVKKLKKRQKAHEKELAERRQREMEEADKAGDYDERDLTGLKVSHGADEFNEGEEIVLTLKDSRVLAGEGKLPDHSYTKFGQKLICEGCRG
jgi:U4/U6.U5 tri-snRNP-associated protein 1